MSDVAVQEAMAEFNQVVGNDLVSKSTPGSTTPESGQYTQGEVAIRNVGDFQQQAPEVYEAMLQGIAYSIIKDMREHQQRIKEINREGRTV